MYPWAPAAHIPVSYDVVVGAKVLMTSRSFDAVIGHFRVQCRLQRLTTSADDIVNVCGRYTAYKVAARPLCTTVVDWMIAESEFDWDYVARNISPFTLSAL